MSSIAVKRAYEKAARTDGFRILVDRLWPRGLSKGKAAIDLWLKSLAPSDGLRRWFGHDPDKWDAFQDRYFAELNAVPDAVGELRELLANHAHTTLVYAARDVAHNNAVALRIYLDLHG